MDDRLVAGFFMRGRMAGMCSPRIMQRDYSWYARRNYNPWLCVTVSAAQSELVYQLEALR